MKRLIIGGPKSGKTTYAKKLAAQSGASLQHTDDFQGQDWSMQSDSAAEAIKAAQPNSIIEGVTVVRGLRKLLKDKPTKAPADEIVIISEPMALRNNGQIRMAQAQETMWREVEGQIKTQFPEIKIKHLTKKDL